ncbi:hypothetical protein PCE1_003404 [Barthelona sp. PCE]
MVKLFILLAILFCLTSAEVRYLTPDDFDHVVNGDKSVLIAFKAPWCGHCQRLAPHWSEAAKLYANKKDTVIAEVNCDDHRALCQKYGIRGYPTIKFFKKGTTEPEDYTAGRSTEDIVKFLNDKTGHKIRSVAAASEVLVLNGQTFDKILEKDCAFVKFFAPWCGHCKSLAPKFEEVAAAFAGSPEVKIAEIDCDNEANKPVCQAQGVRGYPTIKLFCAGEKTKDYSGAREALNIVNYINKNTGADRNLDGSIGDQYIILEEIGDNLIDRFVEDAAGVVDEVEVAAAKEEGVHRRHIASFYVRAVKKLIDNPEWATKEYNRLGRILDSANLNADRRFNMLLRRKLLARMAHIYDEE